MTLNGNLKSGVFTNDVTRFTADWLTQKQGIAKENIDGAQPMELGPNARCRVGVVARNGKIETNEAFAFLGTPDRFAKFVAELQGARTNPFLKFDPSFDLSWLKLDGASSFAGAFDVDAAKKAEWTKRLGAAADQPGSLESLAEVLRRKHSGNLYESDAARVADQALRTTEFGLLPLKEQLALVDAFVEKQKYQSFQETEQKEAARTAMRRIVLDRHHKVTAPQLISLYAQVRGQELARAGGVDKAASLYDLAAKIDPNNLTAAARLGSFEALKAAYDAGIRDDDLMKALAEAHAARGDFKAAVAVAYENRGNDFPLEPTASELAWETKLLEWAVKDDDLLFLNKILRERSNGLSRIKDEARQAIMISLDDHERWGARAERYWKAGDYNRAYECFTHSVQYANAVVRKTAAGGLERAYLSNSQRDEALTKKILARRDELNKDRAGLAATALKRYEALSALVETNPIGGDFAAQDAELKRLETANNAIKELATLAPAIKRLDFDSKQKAVDEATWRLASGALHGDDAMLAEGLRRVNEFRRYAGLEAKKELVFHWALSQYHGNSRFIFSTDIRLESYQRIEGYEAKLEDVQALAIVKTVARLKAENPTLAAYGESVLGNLRDSARKGAYRVDWNPTFGLLYDPVKTGAFVDGFAESGYDDLKTLNDGLESIYGRDDAFQAFMTEVDKTRRADSLEENADYQKRLDLEDGLQTLPSYATLMKAFEVAQMKKGEGIPSTTFEESRTFLLERAKLLKSYLASDDYAEVLGKLPGEQGAMAEHYNQMEIDALAADIVALEALKIPSDNDPARAAKLAVVLPKLRDMSFKCFAYEQSRLRALMDSQASVVESIPTVGDNPLARMDAARTALQSLPSFAGQSAAYMDDAERRKAIADVDAQTKAYRAASNLLDDVAFTRAIDLRIEGVKQAGKSTRGATRIAYNWITVGGLLADWEPTDPHGEMQKKLEEAKALWSAGDKNGARRLYMALNSAAQNDSLKDDEKWAGYLNTLVAVEAVILAAATAGAAAEFVAPFAEATFGSGAVGMATFWTNATVFVASNRVYTGLFQDGFNGAWEGLASIGREPLKFGEEVLLTAGMFKFMGVFQKTVGPVLGKTLGHAAGDFVAEGVGFQIWNFIQTNYEMIRHGKWDPMKALHNSFNVASLDSGFIHGFLFLVALKTGGVLSAPLTRPMNEAARNLAYKTLGIDAMERKLQGSLEANTKAIDAFFRKGQGRLEDLLRDQETILLEQKNYLEKLPEDVRNADALSLNAKMLGNVRQFQSAYGRSLIEKLSNGSNNAFGVTVLKTGLLQYRGEKGVALVEAAKADPSVKAVRVAKNGLVIVDMVDPFGRPARLRFAPRGVGPAELKAMQTALTPPSLFTFPIGNVPMGPVRAPAMFPN